jgi:hypothetical protein
VGLTQSSEPPGAIDTTTWHERDTMASTETTWAWHGRGQTPTPSPSGASTGRAGPMRPRPRPTRRRESSCPPRTQPWRSI